MSTQRNFPGAERRRPPAKQRADKRCRCNHRGAQASSDDSTDDPAAYSAPSHMGGQFEDAGYSSGRGVFGFQSTD